ncbi:MAG: molybdate ABC transporter permease subunit [Gammaproteobacteria bacterium]
MSAVLLTLQVATVATVIALVPGVLMGYVLARFDFWGKRILSSVVGVTLVLPPTAVGYLLLQLLAPAGILGRDTLGIDLDLLLTWKGAVLAAIVMSLPLVVRTARVALEAVDPRLEEMARTLGYSPLKTFLFFTLPMAYKGLLAAIILGFTRAIGEFGATVIIAGNIPGETQTIASAIYTAQQVGNDREALVLLLVALSLGLVAIYAVEYLSPTEERKGL